MLYTIGIHYSLVAASASSSKNYKPLMSSEEGIMSMKHWALVFNPKNHFYESRRVEVGYDSDGMIQMRNTSHNMPLPSYPFADYEGYLSDIDEVLKIHPMAGHRYSMVFNNCQHFVATFLVFLEAFASKRWDRVLSVTDSARWTDIYRVLRRTGSIYYNEPNRSLQAATDPFIATCTTAVTGTIVSSTTAYIAEISFRREADAWKSESSFTDPTNSIMY